MNNDELKKKILSIVRGAMIEADELPFIETTDNIADALIEAGIGDVKEAEHRAEVAERALDKATELAYEYRTEMDTLSCSSCPVFDDIFPRCKDRGLYEECSKRWKEVLIEQAEKELAEERKDE